MTVSPSSDLIGPEKALSSSPGQSPTPAPRQIRTRRFPPYGSSVNEPCGYEPQMRTEASSASFYSSPYTFPGGKKKKCPRLQLLTVEELLEGQRVDYPPSQQVNVTHKKAPKAKGKGPEQQKLI